LLSRESSWDPTRIGQLLAADVRGTSATLYRGIRRLQSGQLVRIGPEGEESEPLPALAVPAVAHMDVREIALRVRYLIDASIARSVGSAKKIGVCVGGLDSSALLAAVVARTRGATDTEVKALTLHFAGRNDDRPYVRDICRALDIEPIRFKPEECANYLLLPSGVDANPLVMPTWAWRLKMSRWAGEQGIDLLLSGDGGDPLFDGDTSIFATDLLRGHPIRAVRAALGFKGYPYFASTRRRLSTLLLSPALHQMSPLVHGLIHTARARRQMSKDCRWAGPALRPWIDRKRSTYYVSTRLMAASDDFLDTRDHSQHVRLFSGCRAADPYLDDDLVSFVDALPKHLLFHGGYRRGLFRFAFQDLLPDSVRLRETKSSFEAALVEVFVAGGGENLVRTYSSMSHLADLGFIEPREFAVRLEQLVRNPAEGTQWIAIWPALVMEAFLRQRTAVASDEARAA
jgi:asparagine synthetase B (glutamine-hydrolysing)